MKLYDIVMNFFNNDFEMVIVYFVLFLFILLLSEWIERNHYKIELKKEVNERIDAKILRYMSSGFSRPTHYIMDLEYDLGGKIYKKRLRTYGKFAVKYKDKDSIQIVVIPSTNRVFFYEESWKEINDFLRLTIYEISFILVLVTIAGFI